ncbi:MAG: alpha/beta hydrolase [Thermoplasmata archaeon]|nr:alpha/beta hydrolase [Thermoplasmata archaeon]
MSRTVTTPPFGSVELSVSERGTGAPVLLLHGGAGPQSVVGLAQLLTDRHPVQVYTPTHPGFMGTPRPEWLNSVPRLAEVYARLMDQLDRKDVTVIGNSIGGWIAAELALLRSPRLGRLILVDAAGIVVEGHPIADFFHLSMEEVTKRSFHNPAASPLNVATLTDQQKAGMAANRTTLAVYSGQPPMLDDSLRSRLHAIDVPTLVLWGESDRIVDPEYGRAYASSIPNAQFELLRNAGHLPQIETPEQLVTAVWTFVEKTTTRA